MSPPGQGCTKEERQSGEKRERERARACAMGGDRRRAAVTVETREGQDGSRVRRVER
jgi:hypothetical protein